MGIGFLVEPQKRGKFHRNLYLLLLQTFAIKIQNRTTKQKNGAGRARPPHLPALALKKEGNARTHSFPRSPAR